MKKKYLTRLFEGLTTIPRQAKEFIDLVYLDIFPDTTRQLDLWETQWGLQAGSLTEQERRDRLDATWKAIGDQDPKYIQDTLQSNGFNVFIHEWWVPGSEAAVNVKACATPRNPTAIIVPPAYVLVNKIITTQRQFTIECGEPLAQCGEPLAQCGQYSTIAIGFKEYEIPTDMDKWPYFLYFGDAVFPNFANVPASRKDEFETLVLKLCPAQQWLGMLINYI